MTQNHVLTVWFTPKCSTVSSYHLSSCLKSNCVRLWGFAALLLPEGSCPSADKVAALLLLAREACVGARRRLITLLSRGLSWKRRAEWQEQIKKDPTWNHIMEKTSSTTQRKTEHCCKSLRFWKNNTEVMEREIQTKSTEGLNTAISYVALHVLALLSTSHFNVQRLTRVQQRWMLNPVKAWDVFDWALQSYIL